MRKKIINIALICMVFFLLSCGTVDVEDQVIENVGLNRFVSGSSVEKADGYKRYEAEDWYVYGGGIKSDDAFLYSGGKYVNNLNNNIAPAAFPGNWAGRSYVKFAVKAPKDGVYYVDLVLNNGAGDEPNSRTSSTIMIRVNDVKNVPLEISDSPSWNRMNV